MATKKKWIQEALSGRKGTLRAYARRVGAVNKDGTLNLPKLERRVDKTGNLRRRREVTLAETLIRFRHRSGTPCHHKPHCRGTR